MSTHKGLLIAVEGIGGSGKTYALEEISDLFTTLNRQVLLTSAPGTGIMDIRPSVFETKHPAMNVVTKALLFMADRCEHVQKEIVPALLKDMVVVVERFKDTTRAYQGYGDGLNCTLLFQVDDIPIPNFPFHCIANVIPDLTVLLDVDPEEGLRRMDTAQYHSYDRLEEEFQQRVRLGYLELAGVTLQEIESTTEPIWSINDWLVINANQSLEKVLHLVWKSVIEWYGWVM